MANCYDEEYIEHHKYCYNLSCNLLRINHRIFMDDYYELSSQRVQIAVLERQIRELREELAASKAANAELVRLMGARLVVDPGKKDE